MNHRIRRIKIEVVAGDPRTIDRDVRVPLKIRGLFHLLVSLRPRSGYPWGMKLLSKQVPDDQYTIEACFELLKELGYAKKTKIVDRKTRKTKYWKWTIYESGPETTIEVPKVRAVQTFLTGFDPRPSKDHRKELMKTASPIVPAHADIIYRISWGITSPEQIRVLTSADRGRVFSVLGRIKESGGDLNDLNYFEDWWKKNWRSRDKISNQYNPPRPEQILEHWWLAYKDREDRLKSTHVQLSREYNKISPDPAKLHEVMQLRGLSKNGRK